MGITDAFTGSITTQYTKPITTQYTKPKIGSSTNSGNSNVSQTIVNSVNAKLAAQAAASAAARYNIASARSGGAGYNARVGKSTSTKTYAPNYVTDYNDPYALNSVADVLFNREAKAKALAGIGMDKNYFNKHGILADIASIVPASLDLLWQQTIKPIAGLSKYGYDSTTGSTFDKVKGAISGAGKGFGQAGLNALTNVIETADIPANYVKGATIPYLDSLKQSTGADTYTGAIKSEAQRLLSGRWDATDAAALANAVAASSKGVVDSLGVGKNGRVNYDFNTGNTGKDILLELTSDPLTWISLGTAGAAKAGIKGVTKKVLSESTQQVSKKASSKLAKSITREYLQSASKEALEDITKRVLDSKPVRDMAKQALKEAAENSTAKISKAAARTFAADKYSDIAKTIVEKISKDAGIKTAKQVYGVSEGIQSALFKAALGTTPLGASAYAINGAKYVSNLLSNKLLKPVDKASLKVFNNLESLITKDFSNTQKVKPIIAPAAQETVNVYKTASDFIDNTARFTQTLAKAQEVDVFATVKNTSTLFDDYFKSVSNILDNETYKKLLTTDDYNTLATKYIDLKNQIAENIGLAPDTSLDTIKATLNKITQQYTAQIARISQQYNLTDLQIILDSPTRRYVELLGGLDEPTQRLVHSIKQNKTKLRYISELTDAFDDYSNSVRDALHKVADKKTLEDTARLFDDAATNPYVNKTVDNRTINEIIKRGQAMSAKNLQKVSDLALKEIENGQYRFGEGNVYKFDYFTNKKDRAAVRPIS